MHADSSIAPNLLRIARGVGFSSSKVHSAIRAQRIPGVASENQKNSA